MGAPKPQVWFNIEEAAEFVGLTPRQLTRRVQEKTIPHYRPSGITGPVKFHRDDLSEYMASCRVEAAR
ncbi:helix-turn-helix domain-containing protein [Actinomadura formosensis]|uniref:helix-turn-helix domain-containing protein n=1 Tax=Actinomadura formosensis TaxID=60706 RepID=UPI000835180E|nr:helix-turn-helix domain-containing protein [Actinomadura formosensis]